MKMVYSKNLKKQNPNYGGKANHLISAKILAIEVPEFVIVPADYLSALIPDYTVSIKEFIQNYQFPEEYINEIFSYFKETDYVAVRSSAINEDGQENSFAGLYETRLFVNRDSLSEALISVWLSSYSERIEIYKKQNNIKDAGIAIIVQRMIDADTSGVAFAVNPLTENHNETVINAVWGLGEGIVSGEINADLYTIENANIRSVIAEKKWAIKFDPTNKKGTHKVLLNEVSSNKSSLTNEQVLEVYKLVNSLSFHFKNPQDVEFAFQNKTLYLLQSRPITTLKTQSEQCITIWDNSNIIESYPALTFPLTFSFIVKMYESVYRQLSLILGVSSKTITKNSEVYANMLGLLWGRVYYNLNHWHKTLSFLPGYKINAGFMDQMMGVKEKFETETTAQGHEWKEYFKILVALFKILKKHYTLTKDRIEFQKHFNEVIKAYNAMNFSKMSLTELLQHYLRFENTLVSKWEAPLVNDFFCMIYFGILQKLVIKYQLDEQGTLHNDLVSGSKDIVSTEPITLTLLISEKISKFPEALQLFKYKTPQEILKELQKSQFSDINESIQNYIQKWGDRSVAELKLETITYKQQPENYIRILQSYVRHEQTSLPHTQNSKRQEAEEILRKKLNGSPIKKLIFSYVLKKARDLVSYRENLRFERTRGFGMVRTMYSEVGKKLAANHTIEHERDVFYLTQKEIFDYVNGTSVQMDLKSLVQMRKLEYLNFEKTKLPERIKSKGIIYDFKIETKSEKEVKTDDTLKGIGCCSGIVRGTACVVHAPHDIESLQNNIMVTASTDPGWVVLFPSAAAIVVERGSLLSHSAIVSREMGIPCVVGVKNLLDKLKTGDSIEVDGTSGTIKILNRA